MIAEKWIPVEHLNEIKSALIIALSSKGRMMDALEIYDDMKKSGCWVEPKAIVCIIVSIDISLSIFLSLKDFVSYYGTSSDLKILLALSLSISNCLVKRISLVFSLLSWFIL